MSDDLELDRTRCPVCGARNSCAIELGSKEPCWCIEVRIAAEALERIPSSLVDKACLCPACAAFTAPGHTGETA